MALGIVALRLWVGTGLGGATRAILVMSHGMFLTWRVRIASNKFMLPKRRFGKAEPTFQSAFSPLNVLSPKYGTHATVLLASESPHYVMLVKCHCATGRRGTVRRGGVRPSRTQSQTVETHHETTAPAFIRKVALQFLLDIPLTLN
jgi:hypothetical protein